MKEILQHIRQERDRQDIQWGANRHLDIFFWLSILGEEVGESHKAALEDHPDDLRDELIQVAAVAVAIIEDIDSRNSPTLRGIPDQSSHDQNL